VVGVRSTPRKPLQTAEVTFPFPAFSNKKQLKHLQNYSLKKPGIVLDKKGKIPLFTIERKRGAVGEASARY